MEQIQITLPESWSEISINKYIEITQIKEKGNKFIIELLLILCDNLTREIIDTFDSSYLEAITQNLGWISISPDLETINKQYKIGNDIYQYERNFDKLTLGEMISYEQLLETSNKDISVLLTLAIILRKVENDIEEDFNSDIINERMELFGENLNINEVFGLVFFFRNGGKDYITILEDSLKELRKLKKEILT